MSSQQQLQLSLAELDLAKIQAALIVVYGWATMPRQRYCTGCGEWRDGPCGSKDCDLVEVRNVR